MIICYACNVYNWLAYSLLSFLQSFHAQTNFNPMYESTTWNTIESSSVINYFKIIIYFFNMIRAWLWFSVLFVSFCRASLIFHISFVLSDVEILKQRIKKLKILYLSSEQKTNNKIRGFDGQFRTRRSKTLQPFPYQI